MLRYTLFTSFRGEVSWKSHSRHLSVIESLCLAAQRDDNTAVMVVEVRTQTGKYLDTLRYRNGKLISSFAII